jgi:hypothetical protein
MKPMRTPSRALPLTVPLDRSGLAEEIIAAESSGMGSQLPRVPTNGAWPPWHSRWHGWIFQFFPKTGLTKAYRGFVNWRWGKMPAGLN